MILNEYSGTITNVKSARSKNGTPMTIITLGAKNRKGQAKSVNLILMNPKMTLKAGYVVSIRCYDEPSPSKTGKITHFVDEIDVLGVDPRANKSSQPAPQNNYNRGYNRQEAVTEQPEEEDFFGDDTEDSGDDIPF